MSDINQKSFRFTIRFTQEEKREIISKAIQKNKNISEYIKSKIFDEIYLENSPIYEKLDEVEKTLNLMLAVQDKHTDQEELFPMLAETLLFLRKTAQPKTITEVNATLKRHDITRKEFA